jgi:hypothetical protein
VRRFQLRTASSLRSMARFSGFCGLKPKEPRIRQTCVCPKRTPCRRSMTAPIRLSVHNSVPKPYSVGLRRSEARTVASCSSSSCAGRPRSGTARSASIPPSSSSPFHVYTLCRATPTSLATSAQPLPRFQSLLCCFAHPLLCHHNSLQDHSWIYNASDDQRLSSFTERSII